MATLIDRSAVRQPRTDGRERLLDAAERLFGEHGVDAVSLREIAAAAGHLNNSAVHYHFQDKEGLIAALFTDRVGKVEQRRQAALREAGDLDGLDAETLFRIIWQPVVDYCRDCGSNWFAQHHVSFHDRQNARGHPVTSDPDRFPTSYAMLMCLERRSGLPLDRFRHRLGLIFTMFWAVFARQDSLEHVGPVPGFKLTEVTAVAIAALEL